MSDRGRRVGGGGVETKSCPGRQTTLASVVGGQLEDEDVWPKRRNGADHGALKVRSIRSGSTGRPGVQPCRGAEVRFCCFVCQIFFPDAVFRTPLFTCFLPKATKMDALFFRRRLPCGPTNKSRVSFSLQFGNEMKDDLFFLCCSLRVHATVVGAARTARRPIAAARRDVPQKECRTAQREVRILHPMESVLYEFALSTGLMATATT